MSTAFWPVRSRHDDPTLSWLLHSADPSIRYLTRVAVLGESEDAPDVRRARAQIVQGPKVRALLSGQRPDGGFGVHPYKKWNGAHWRLVSLTDLGMSSDVRLGAAADQVLRWLTGSAHRSRITCIRGLWRRCGSQEGNALLACSRLGITDDPRVRGLAEDLVTWQWPDGGWNCDRRPAAHHSSFHESLIPLHGLIAYRAATGDRSVGTAIDRAAEFFLRHRLFRSERTGEPIQPRRVDGRRRAPHLSANEFTLLRYPGYWHYNVLRTLDVLALIDRLDDPRARDALDLLEQKRRPDGRWNVEGCYWQSPGSGGSNVEVVDWGRRGPNEMITLYALRVLAAAGRWSPQRARN